MDGDAKLHRTRACAVPCIIRDIVQTPRKSPAAPPYMANPPRSTPNLRTEPLLARTVRDPHGASSTAQARRRHRPDDAAVSTLSARPLVHAHGAALRSVAFRLALVHRAPGAARPPEPAIDDRATRTPAPPTAPRPLLTSLPPPPRPATPPSATRARARVVPVCAPSATPAPRGSPARPGCVCGLVFADLAPRRAAAALPARGQDHGCLAAAHTLRPRAADGEFLTRPAMAQRLPWPCVRRAPLPTRPGTLMR